jgi:hypothetical protein
MGAHACEGCREWAIVQYGSRWFCLFVLAVISEGAVGALTYDDERHEYRIDGQRVPSVTQALKLAGHITAQFYTRLAAARGTAVHLATEQIDRRRPPTLRFQAPGAGAPRLSIEAYVDAYAAFKRDCKPRYEAIERMRSHARERYAGRPDRIVADLFGERGIAEFKTGAEEKWHGYQTALYQLMDPAGSRWVIYLLDDGRYKLRAMRNAEDYAIGLHAVRRAHLLLTGEQRFY